jgi:hypothetical protein
MNQITLAQVKEKIIEQIADNYFLSYFHQQQGNTEVSKNMLKHSIGLAEFGRDQFGFETKELHNLAIEIYHERKAIMEGRMKK